MKTLNTFTKNTLAATVVALILPLVAYAQATKSVTLSPVRTNFQQMPGRLVGMDLIKKIKEINPSMAMSLEIQLVKVEAKSGIGGSQVLLRINRQMVDSVVVETDPGKDSDIARVELRNITRGDLSDAFLVIQNYNNIRISNIEVILGPVAEVTVMGRYADDQANRIGGVNDDQDTKPSADTIAAIRARYYTPGVAPVYVDPNATPPPQPVVPVAPVPVPAPTVLPTAPVAVPAVSDTAYNRDGVGFKNGDIVRNRWGDKGQIIALDVVNGIATVVFENIGQKTRGVNDLYK